MLAAEAIAGIIARPMMDTGYIVTTCAVALLFYLLECLLTWWTINLSSHKPRLWHWHRYRHGLSNCTSRYFFSYWLAHGRSTHPHSPL